MCIDLLPEKLLQVIKRKKNDMNETSLPNFFHIKYPNVVLSLTIINFQNVPFYLYNFLFLEGQKNTLLKAI